MIDLLRQYGLKATKQRKKILEALTNSINQHLSVEELYNVLKSNSGKVSLATIYRVLGQFENLGIVGRHNFENNCAFFELTFKKKHHDHFICNKCGIIIDFFDKLIEERQIVNADKYRFKITGHALKIFGICASCNT